MIKISDYIVKRLVEYGVRHVFMITGGGAMHLNDSVGKCGEIEFICNHHEQASAIGAEGYARTSGKIGVVVVTSGPGGTNTLTGVIGQWLDSVPALYISGQVKRETTIERCRDLGLRQLGDQEINIVDIVRPVTKFATMVNEPKEIRHLLEKSLYLATHGRPGPVWLDVPLDVQGALVDESSLQGYDPGQDLIPSAGTELKDEVSEVMQLLRKAERPVILAGQGIRLSGAQGLFLETVEKMRIPVVSTFCGYDLIPTEHPLFIGRIGTIGNRAGNFALQNADLLLSVGSRNNIRQISYNWSAYARAATRIIVDIDAAELNKPTVRPDLAILSDAGLFLEEMKLQTEAEYFPEWKGWLEWCHARKERYPAVTSAHRVPRDKVNPYYFIEELTALLKHDAVMVAGNGSACVVLFQAGKVKENQRIFWNSGCASMGYDLPAAIGACFANDKKDVVCLAGDGSLQMNIQELQTVAYHQLPIKLFVLNNNGYVSIRQTQDAFFDARYVGCDSHSGVSFPDTVKIAQAYGLATEIIDSHHDLKGKIGRILDKPGPVVCDVRLSADYKFEPKLSSERKPDGRIVSKPLEDMYPFLDREEFKENMLVEEWQQGEKG
ncbi:MAG: acetolactate synthase, acetolactate synthase large subunit [Geobacteraceae bacterium]|nr:acetolactate synthase, acetolactate synthase large subunit [Geobacteraceae bacterium]